MVWFSFRSDRNFADNTAVQEFEDFVREGPINENIPPDLLIELYEVIFSAADGMIDLS